MNEIRGGANGDSPRLGGENSQGGTGYPLVLRIMTPA
jgi:hypothetical protein